MTGGPAQWESTAFHADGDRLVAACGTQRDEISAFIELLRTGDLPAAGALRGGGSADLQGLLGERPTWRIRRTYAPSG